MTGFHLAQLRARLAIEGEPQNLLERNIGRQLEEADEFFLYRQGHDDGSDRMMTEWWVCNSCGALLVDNQHFCKKPIRTTFRKLEGELAAPKEDRESHPSLLEDMEGAR